MNAYIDITDSQDLYDFLIAPSTYPDLFYE